MFQINGNVLAVVSLLLSGAAAQGETVPADFLSRQAEELSRDVPLAFNPDDGLNFRKEYEDKYGHRGERLIAWLGQGVPTLKIYDASLLDREKTTENVNSLPQQEQQGRIVVAASPQRTPQQEPQGRFIVNTSPQRSPQQEQQGRIVLNPSPQRSPAEQEQQGRFFVTVSPQRSSENEQRGRFFVTSSPIRSPEQQQKGRFVVTPSPHKSPEQEHQVRNIVTASSQRPPDQGHPGSNSVTVVFDEEDEDKGHNSDDKRVHFPIFGEKTPESSPRGKNNHANRWPAASRRSNDWGRVSSANIWARAGRDDFTTGKPVVGQTVLRNRLGTNNIKHDEGQGAPPTHFVTTVRPLSSFRSQQAPWSRVGGNGRKQAEEVTSSTPTVKAVHTTTLQPFRIIRPVPWNRTVEVKRPVAAEATSATENNVLVSTVKPSVSTFRNQLVTHNPTANLVNQPEAVAVTPPPFRSVQVTTTQPFRIHPVPWNRPLQNEVRHQVAAEATSATVNNFLVSTVQPFFSSFRNHPEPRNHTAENLVNKPEPAGSPANNNHVQPFVDFFRNQQAQRIQAAHNLLNQPETGIVTHPPANNLQFSDVQPFVTLIRNQPGPWNPTVENVINQPEALAVTSSPVHVSTVQPFVGSFQNQWNRRNPAAENFVNHPGPAAIQSPANHFHTSAGQPGVGSFHQRVLWNPTVNNVNRPGPIVVTMNNTHDSAVHHFVTSLQDQRNPIPDNTVNQPRTAAANNVHVSTVQPFVRYRQKPSNPTFNQPETAGVTPSLKNSPTVQPFTRPFWNRPPSQPAAKQEVKKNKTEEYSNQKWEQTMMSSLWGHPSRADKKRLEKMQKSSGFEALVMGDSKRPNENENSFSPDNETRIGWEAAGNGPLWSSNAKPLVVRVNDQRNIRLEQGAMSHLWYTPSSISPTPSTESESKPVSVIVPWYQRNVVSVAAPDHIVRQHKGTIGDNTAESTQTSSETIQANSKDEKERKKSKKKFEKKYVEIDRKKNGRTENALQNTITQDSNLTSPDGIVYQRLYGAIWNHGATGLQIRNPSLVAGSTPWPLLQLDDPHNKIAALPGTDDVPDHVGTSIVAGPTENSPSEDQLGTLSQPAILLRSYSYYKR